MSTLSSDPDKTQKGWGFFTGSSQVDSTQSKSLGRVAKVKYGKIDFTFGHSHSFGYGNGKRSLPTGKRDASVVGREVAEFDDDFIEWNKFKVFHIRGGNVDAVDSDGWNTMTWSERSLQNSAQNTWSRGGKGGSSAGAIAGTVLGVLAVAVVAVGVVGYALHRRRKNLKKAETPSLGR